jgi:hypothetical protein
VLGASPGCLLSETHGHGGHDHPKPRQSLATPYTVIDGKIARVTLFPDEEQALEAVGLRE